MASQASAAFADPGARPAAHEPLRLPPRIETLLFDFGGTLDADGIPWKERFHALYADEGLRLSAEAFAPAFYAADDPLVGGISPSAGLAETAQALGRNLEAALAARGLAPAADAARGRRVAERFLSPMSSRVVARNRPLLETLARRYRLGIVSNFYGNLEAVCESAGLAPLFGAIADSAARRRREAGPGNFPRRARRARRVPRDGGLRRRFAQAGRRGRAPRRPRLHLDRGAGRGGRRGRAYRRIGRRIARPREPPAVSVRPAFGGGIIAAGQGARLRRTATA